MKKPALKMAVKIVLSRESSSTLCVILVTTVLPLVVLISPCPGWDILWVVVSPVVIERTSSSSPVAICPRSVYWQANTSPITIVPVIAL